MDIHNVHIDEHHATDIVDQVKSEICERHIFHNYPAQQHINAVRQHPPTNPLMHYSSQRNISSHYHRPNEEHLTNDPHRTTRSIDNTVSLPYPSQSHANEMILNRKLYSNNSTYSSLSNNILNNRPTTATTTFGTNANYTHRMMLNVGTNLLQPAGFITRQDRDSMMFGAYMNDERQQLSATSDSPLNMRYDVEMGTSGYESAQSAAHSFHRNSNIYPSSTTSDSLFNDSRINFENYTGNRNMEHSFVSDPESLNRTIGNHSDSSSAPSCEVSRKQNSRVTDTTTIEKNERTLDENSQNPSVKEDFSSENSTTHSVDSSSNFKGNLQSNPKSPTSTDSVGGDLSKSADVSSTDEQMKASSNEEPLQPCNASESSDISRESDDVNNESTSVQSESSVNASPNDRRSPQQSSSSCSATTNETPASSSTDVVALQPEISSRPLQQSFPQTFSNTRYPYQNGSSGEVLSNVTRPPGSFIRPCITGSHSTATFLHPNGTVIQTNGTFLPSPTGFYRLNDGLTPQMNGTTIGVNNATQICSTSSNSLAMTVNDGITNGCTTRLLTTAEMNAMEVSALNRMMGIVLPKNKGNSNLKREWHNVGWFTSEEEMNAVRKRQKVSKWKSVDQISGLKVFFRCNKWKRTNCNYRMFVMYYAMDRISLNESGEHDHSALYVDGKSRDDDTPPRKQNFFFVVFVFFFCSFFF